jgi:hypothetical protein
MTNTLVLVAATTAVVFLTAGVYIGARAARPQSVRQPSTAIDLKAVARLVKELLPLFMPSKAADDKQGCHCRHCRVHSRKGQSANRETR